MYLMMLVRERVAASEITYYSGRKTVCDKGITHKRVGKKYRDGPLLPVRF